MPSPLPSPPSKSGGQKETDISNARFYIGIAMILLHVVLITAGGVFTKPDDGIKFWIPALVFSVLHWLTSFTIINEQEKGCLIFFGEIIRRLESGLHFTPLPFRVRLVTKNSIQVDFGTLDDESRIELANEAESSDTRFVFREPVRINFGDVKTSKLSDEEKKIFANDPEAKTLITDPHLYFRMKVSDLPQLILTCGSVEEAIDRIKDTCITALSEEAGKTFVAIAKTQLKEMNEKLKKRVEALVGDPDALKRAGIARAIKNSGSKDYNEDDLFDVGDSWGIDIEEVNIKDLGTPKRTNEAAADRAKAIALADGEAIAAVRKAEGEKLAAIEKADTTITTATAKGKETVLLAEGQAKAASLLINASNNETGRLILKLDALKEGLKHGKAVIVPMDMGAMTGVVGGLKEALDAVSGKPTSTPPAPPTNTGTNNPSTGGK